MNKKQLKIVTGVAIAVLIISIIPMLWISQYLHPFADDYVFGAEVYKIWNETHSFPACVQTAWNVAMTMYHTWQGTYSACFLMALQPGVFGQYWLGTFILISSLVTSTYTLLYSMSLFLASLLIGYQLSSSKFKKALIGGASIVLSIIIAGGNFVSGLGMGAILFAAILIMKMEQRKWPRLYITILTIYGIAFLFSVLAPGNAFRQVTIESKPNVVVAFFMAIGKSFEFLSESINIAQILMLMLLSPTLVKAASSSRFKFSHPWLCILITVTLYSSFFFAHSYAMGTRGPGRVQNIYSYIHLWLICINIYYLSGAVLRKAEAKAPLSSAIIDLVTASKKKYANSLQYAPYCAIVILILSVSLKERTTNRTVSLMLKGTAVKFDKEMNERELALKTNTQSAITLKPLTVKMPSDAFNDIMIYPGYWINQGIARYYGKDKIVASPAANMQESPTMLLARCKRDIGPGNLKFVYIK